MLIFFSVENTLSFHIAEIYKLINNSTKIGKQCRSSRIQLLFFMQTLYISYKTIKSEIYIFPLSLIYNLMTTFFRRNIT
jgi:hypothetical protein